DATKHGVQYSYNSHGYMEKIAEATDTTKKYKQIETVNAWGSETQSMLGNGLKVQSTYHATTGLPDRVLVTNPLTQTIQDNTYAYNDIGILTNRSRFVKSNASTLSETFHYDELNRLTQATATGLPTQSFQYDIKGNITSKSDVGTYTYGAGSAGPHAVTTAGSDTFTYDATGNMLTGGGRTVTYNTFRKPLTLSKGTHTSTFTYGPDRSHYKRVDADGTTVKTTLSIGNVEFITHSSGVTETKRYIGDIAVVTETSNGSPSTQYLHKDTLGSTDIITDAVGGVVAEMSFDAFGKRRNVLTLAELAEAQYDVLNAITTQGFTGHEMVDEVGIIHMGGRIYDPELGRFMSADPIVQSISNAQNLNRYSYVLNNPLSLVDPSGFRS
ncbi:MAG: RHS repeat-associated core domain-containing protein, partial [Gammaproteobacteria bacterium]|nr:RHS repeat-associated core domain-containing protein [Gammaproteobacteria bacterium]